MEFKYKVGDRLRVINNWDSKYIKGSIFIVSRLDDGCGEPPVYRDENSIGIYETYVELADNSIIENTMEKKVFHVLIVDKKTGKTTKNENVIAIDEQKALLQAFGVDTDNSFIKLSELGKFEEKEPVTAILVKEDKK